MKELFYSRGELVDRYGSPFKHKDLVVVDLTFTQSRPMSVTLFWYGECSVFMDELDKYVQIHKNKFEGFYTIGHRAGVYINSIDLCDLPGVTIFSAEIRGSAAYNVATTVETAISVQINPAQRTYLELNMAIPVYQAATL